MTPAAAPATTDAPEGKLPASDDLRGRYVTEEGVPGGGRADRFEAVRGSPVRSAGVGVADRVSQ